MRVSDEYVAPRLHVRGGVRGLGWSHFKKKANSIERKWVSSDTVPPITTNAQDIERGELSSARVAKKERESVCVL